MTDPFYGIDPQRPLGTSSPTKDETRADWIIASACFAAIIAIALVFWVAQARLEAWVVG